MTSERKNSTEELIRLYQLPIKLFPMCATKTLIPKHADEENQKITEYLSSMKQYFQQCRPQRRKQRCEAIWIPEMRCSKITRLVGKSFPQFGYKEKNEIYLTPEESLFLMETNNLEILWNDVPFSIEQAYAVFCDTKEKLSKYRTFQELAFNGYRMKHTELQMRKRNNRENTGLSDAEIKRLKEDDNDITSESEHQILFERLKQNGPKTLQVEQNQSSLFNAYLPANKDFDIRVISKPNENQFSLETTSQNDTCMLTAFSGHESVAFYQFHQVDLENK